MGINKLILLDCNILFHDFVEFLPSIENRVSQIDDHGIFLIIESSKTGKNPVLKAF
jgi:hypothetical protein